MRYLEDGEDDVMIDPRRFDAQGNPIQPDQWEDPDLTGQVSSPAPVPEVLAPALAPVERPQPFENAPAPEILRPGYTATLEKLKGAYGDRPQLNQVDASGKAIQPKWWQRAAAMGTGGLAGWTNAAGRIRQPLNVEAMGEKILHPTYETRLQDWQGKVAPLEAQAQIEGQQQGAWWKGQEAAALADQQQAHAQYWRHRAEMETNRFKINGKGQVVDTYTGQLKGGPPTLQDRVEEIKTAFPGISDPDAMKAVLNPQAIGRETAAKPTFNSSDRLAILAAGGNPDNPAPPGDPWWKTFYNLQNPVRPRSPGGGGIPGREQRLKDEANRRIDETKKKTEASILQRRDKDLSDVLLPGQQPEGEFAPQGATESDESYARRVNNQAKITGINQKYAPQLQANQDWYARQTGSPGYDVDPNTLEHKPRGPASPSASTSQASAPKFTVQEVRVRAAARGLDPDAAEAGARAKGLIQ